MACRVMGNAIVCGPTPPRRSCAHCGSDAKSLCDWPIIKPVKVEPVKLKVGDVLIKGRVWRAEVLEIEIKQHALDRRMDYVIVTARRKDTSYEARFAIGAGNLSDFLVEGLGTCDKACCFRCRRAVDTNVEYCQDHWADMAAGRAPLEERGRV